MTTLELPMTGTSAMRRPLIVLGVLWLVLAAVIAVSQLLQPTPITLEWRTETEVNAAGFNVYRALSPEGPYTKVNEELIPASGSAISGASYVFVDENIRRGETYYYRLEDVELDNSTIHHASIEYTAPWFPWWLPLTMVLSLLTGLYLVARGVRVGRASLEEQP